VNASAAVASGNHVTGLQWVLAGNRSALASPDWAAAAGAAFRNLVQAMLEPPGSRATLTCAKESASGPAFTSEKPIESPATGERVSINETPAIDQLVGVLTHRASDQSAAANRDTVNSHADALGSDPNFTDAHENDQQRMSQSGSGQSSVQISHAGTSGGNNSSLDNLSLNQFGRLGLNQQGRGEADVDQAGIEQAGVGQRTGARSGAGQSGADWLGIAVAMNSNRGPAQGASTLAPLPGGGTNPGSSSVLPPAPERQTGPRSSQKHSERSVAAGPSTAAPSLEAGTGAWFYLILTPIQGQAPAATLAQCKIGAEAGPTPAHAAAINANALRITDVARAPVKTGRAPLAPAVAFTARLTPKDDHLSPDSAVKGFAAPRLESSASTASSVRGSAQHEQAPTKPAFPNLPAVADSIPGAESLPARERQFPIEAAAVRSRAESYWPALERAGSSEADAHRPAAVHELAVRISSEGTAPVDIRFHQARNEVSVSVRTLDASLRAELRQSLPQLSNGLERAGFRSEITLPCDANAAGPDHAAGTVEHAAGAVDVNSTDHPGSLHETGREPAEDRYGFAAADSNSGTSQQRQNRQLEAWLEQIES
jgi:hypothetical protein